MNFRGNYKGNCKGNSRGDCKKSIAVVGAGPAGCMSAYFASQKGNVTIFDFKNPLHTLLPTGGGRCNLAYAEYDFKELAKNYPRGEKFLYSVFSKFSTADTIDFFEEIGVKTYVQDDLRIFPTSNSAKDVREKMLNSLKKCVFKREKVLEIYNNADYFTIVTDKNEYKFDRVIISTGGHASYSLAQMLGHTIIEPKPALTGLVTKEDFKTLQGVSLKNVKAEISFLGKKFPPVQGDLLFTHQGISGPLTYTISSICAREKYSEKNPLTVKLDFICHAEFISASIQYANTEKILKRVQDDIKGKTFCFQDLLNSNAKKNIKNLLAEFVPKSIIEYTLKIINVSSETKCCNIDGTTRDLILKSLKEFEINAISPSQDGEVVTSGGVNLDEINPSTMQSKLVEGLYFCGEIINADGFCGGFNLQNCWSTGHIAGINSISHQGLLD